MSAARVIQHDKPRLELKAATRDLIAASEGTSGAAETLSCRQQRMSDCQLKNTADFLRIDEVGALEDIAVTADGLPPVTRALAKRQGFTLVRLPASGPSCHEWHSAIGAVSKETGEAVHAALTSLATAISEDTVREIDEAIEKLVALRALAMCGVRG